MFYDTNHSLWYMTVYWVVVTLVFGVSLHIATKLAHIELERAAEIIVVLVSSLTGLIPAVGPYLAFVVAIFLTYRMTDAGLGMAIAAVIVTRFIAILIAIGALKALTAVGLFEE
jgi:hypothetical protein